jgi:hypothetical protein
MRQVAQFYCHPTRGLGIDLYWARKDFTVLGTSFQPELLPFVPHAYRHIGDIPHDDLLNQADLADGKLQVLHDLRLKTPSVFATPANQAFYQAFYHQRKPEEFIAESRDPVLAQFVKVVLWDRLGDLYAASSNQTSATVLLNTDNAVTMTFSPRQPEKEGTRIHVVAMSEEGYSTATNQKGHYTPDQFIDRLVYSIAHEIAHLLIGGWHNLNSSTTLMTNTDNKPAGISAITTEAQDISLINLRNRYSVSQQ